MAINDYCLTSLEAHFIVANFLHHLFLPLTLIEELVVLWIKALTWSRLSHGFRFAWSQAFCGDLEIDASRNRCGSAFRGH